MHWILIIMVTHGLHPQSGAITTAEFNSWAACKVAAERAEEKFGQLRTTTLCTEKGSEIK